MKVITSESVASTAAERWREQYCPNGEWSSISLMNGEKSPRVIYERLLALGDNPSSESVNEIVGNKCWGSAPRCDECGERGDAVLQVGEEPDYESATAILCMNCVFRAAMLIGKATEAAPCH